MRKVLFKCKRRGIMKERSHLGPTRTTVDDLRLAEQYEAVESVTVRPNRVMEHQRRNQDGREVGAVGAVGAFYLKF
ncbi:hypothetical protein SISNIDRAFT_257121 [Sistotremastrum niveocremeum HHB9708]|uniref:Uncharacterized protein n=1 Tax=Sistotremastrum niveocremeum HHB9708 TaxID=1314777 RepID=A0A164PBT1_9AGAM|nr:hypothetical protein SISNIDRAFT_257121 [Sistotremastrum niveocremeum HHB9708]